ncbi:hypothetical protein ILUMI_04955 [Ignelater luminosus]|uniref:C2H2-type domain-containing protein n=1 Tax=Ignelater luminosus TaxID=2038154 RepID=A0A8K0GJ37_IGNLU|nr:hypothetical protein ILUMI_04955 [Ignelater luminosus]
MHTSETPFTCVTCGEGFHLRNELNHHMATHDVLSPSTPGKHLSCSECGSCFNNPEALALHVKLHSGDASFVNDLCTLTANLQSSSFPGHNNSNNNNSHSNKSIKNENTIQKVKSHICKFCSRAFSAKHGLQQHNKRHPDGTCALKSHICDICNKAFYQKNHLLLHQRQHMDVSMRHPNYSKIKSNEDDNENIYEQHSQEPKTLSHNGNNKSLNSMELTSNANLTDKRPNYLSYYEAYTIPKYQTSAKPDNREPCSSESSPEERKETFSKNHPLLHQRQHMDVNMRHSNYSKTKTSQDDNENIYEQHSQEPKSLSHNGNNKSLNSMELTSNANLTEKRPSYLSYYEGYTIPKYQTSPKPDNREPCSSESSPEERKEAFSKNDCLDNHSDSHRLENLRNVDAKMQISSEIISDMNRNSNGNKSLNPIELTSNTDLTDKRPSYLSYYEDYTIPKYQTSPKPDNQEPCSSESSPEERKEAFPKNHYLENHSDSYRLENLRNVDVKMQISSEIVSDINRSKNDDNFTVTSQTVVQ